ncbi:MAG: hypothetical protein GX424_05380 [Clostridiales bacterium]|nr:hypothetical protein [Clostridiales bacterium]
MRTLAQLILTALAAVSVENILFSCGIGFSRVLRAARRPRTIGLYSLFVAFFSLVSMTVGSLLNPVLLSGEALAWLRPALLALCAAAAYGAAAAALKFGLPEFYRKHGEILSPAAMNTVVLSMPYVQKTFQLPLARAMAFALGTGGAFFLAATLLAHIVPRFKNEDMPKAFSGFPAVLIYLGILSLAFAGFTGGRLF